MYVTSIPMLPVYTHIASANFYISMSLSFSYNQFFIRFSFGTFVFFLLSFSCGNFTYSCCFDALPNLFFAMFFPTIHVYILLLCNTFFFVFFSTIVATFGVFHLLFFFLKDFKNCYCFRCFL